jgi:hypothetical protein
MQLQVYRPASTQKHLPSSVRSRLKKNPRHRRSIRAVTHHPTCENTGPKGHSSKGQRTIQDYTEKHGAVHFVTNNGMSHLFPDAGKATGFRKTTKEQLEAEAAIALYESKGFKAFVAIGEARNTDLWTEFRDFCMARKRTR